MRIDETQKMINDYFAVMGAQGDFSQFYAEDVTWIMIDAGVETRGAAAVRDYVVALHGQKTDVHTHRIAVSEGAACLEGDCINVQKTDAPRIAYCVVYDLADIESPRCAATERSAQWSAISSQPTHDLLRGGQVGAGLIAGAGSPVV